MSGDRPRFIWLPTSFSQGVARADTNTWVVLGILLAVAIAAVVVLNLTYEKKPMFGNAPFGQAQPQQQPERVVPIARPGDVPPPHQNERPAQPQH